MTLFRPLLRAGLAAALLGLAACGAPESGPIEVSAIGGPPRLANPNLEPLDPPSAFLIDAVAQGLVRFNAGGDIEPALAQSWIISDDGLRYTFRLRRAEWANGGRITAYQVAPRLRAALGRSSRSPLKPVLGAIGAIEPMTDEVLEITLRGPRPFFLQLLAHPELAIIQQGAGTGPYRMAAAGPGSVRLQRPPTEEEDAGEGAPEILLRGERAALAIARFAQGQRVLVVGGTIGDLPLARAADLPAGAFVFDPVSGLFGLSFAAREGPLADPAVRRALAMAVDRQALATAIDAPGLAPRTGLVSPGIQELPNATLPDWAALPQEQRRAEAATAIAALELEVPLRLRVAMPEGPGYRLVFAYLRHDWRLIGVDAVRVGRSQAADLIFIDEVAPANLASWYLRRFTCTASAVCDPAADAALLAARLAPRPADRQAQFAIADRILTGLTPFIPLTQPVRWSLVPRRLTGFRPNPFARHPAANLIAERD
jgi:oligopeptide transport system substrate-binding protein